MSQAFEFSKITFPTLYAGQSKRILFQIVCSFFHFPLLSPGTHISWVMTLPPLLNMTTTNHAFDSCDIFSPTTWPPGYFLTCHLASQQRVFSHCCLKAGWGFHLQVRWHCNRRRVLVLMVGFGIACYGYKYWMKVESYLFWLDLGFANSPLQRKWRNLTSSKSSL